MALVVEDGTGKADAESYVSIADANTYAVARGLSFVITDEALAEQALRRATTWFDGTYRSRFPGLKTHLRDQALEWPRAGAWDVVGNAIDSNEIPVEIINACIEAAVREKANSGSLSPDVTPGRIKKRVKVEGAVEVEYAVGTGGPADQAPIVSVIDDILGSLLGPKPSRLFGKSVRA